ncbi:SymE family type I addiction module toxin [Lachnospiraceae bacterium KK002]
MAKKDVRKIKVYEQSGRNYKSTPTIMLKGLWLEELGFGAGTLLTVRCEEGKLVIVPRETVDYIDIDVFEEQQLSMVAERKVRY